MSINENLISQLKSLSKQEKLKVIQILFDIKNEQDIKHEITELAGLGKEIWGNIDAQEYVNKERSDWV